jgi:acyl carrier protein
MTTKHYIPQIREFVTTNFLFGEGGSLRDDTSFMEGGIIDSTGILELVMYLEETYKVKVQPEEMLPENLDSVSRVAGFLSRKLAKETCSQV